MLPRRAFGEKLSMQATASRILGSVGQGRARRDRGVDSRVDSCDERPVLHSAAVQRLELFRVD